MKILSKIVFASAVALAMAGPASAAYFEDQQAQISNPAPRAGHVMGNGRGHRADDSMNHAPLQIDPGYQYFHDSGIGSQS